MVKVKCAVCAKEFEQRLTLSAKAIIPTCSQECAHALSRMNKKVIATFGDGVVVENGIVVSGNPIAFTRDAIIVSCGPNDINFISARNIAGVHLRERNGHCELQIFVKYGFSTKCVVVKAVPPIISKEVATKIFKKAKRKGVHG